MSVKSSATETNAQAHRAVTKRLKFFCDHGDLTIEQVREKFEKVRYSISAAERAHYIALLACFKKIQIMFNATDAMMVGKTINNTFCAPKDGKNFSITMRDLGSAGACWVFGS